MKSLLNYRFYLLLFSICLLIFLSCEKNEVNNGPPMEDAIDPEEEESTDNSDDINQAFKFNSSQLKNGNTPENKNLSDLKLDKDTIKLWPGIKGRVRILNRDEVSIPAVLLQISGAMGYHEVSMEDEQSIDSISVFYVDIDPEGLDLPYDGDITISPIDPNGDVIDEFDLPIHIDPPFDENVGAGPDGMDKGSCTPKMATPYFWIYTTVEGVFYDAPGYPRTGDDYEVLGCCTVDDNPKSVPCLGRTPNARVIVTNDYSLTNEEFIKLFVDKYIYQLARSINSFSYDNSDFCLERPGYSLSNVGLTAIGDFLYSPANGFETFYNFTIKTMDVTDRDFGVFPRIGPNENSSDSQAYINCNYLVATSLTEGVITTRVFERQADGMNWHF